MDENGLGEDYEDENKLMFWSEILAIVVFLAVIIYLFFKG